MPKTILKNVSVMADAVLLTTRAKSVDIDESANQVDVTAFGGNGYQEFEQGLKTGQVAVEFYQDFDAGSVHATLRPLFDNDTEFELRIGPDGDTGATDNPVWVGTVKLFGYKHLSGTVGDASINPVTFAITGPPSLDTGA